MRLSPVLYVVPAALLVAAVAFAAKPASGTANITSLSASGITGTADIKFEQSGLARVHESITGLTPGVQYESLVFQGSTTCGSGTSAVLMTFTANAAGKANFNVSAPPQVNIQSGASISVERVSDSALVACGEVVVQ